MTFYLQDSERERRLIIHSMELPGCKTDQVCQADSWMEAKKRFGFSLTAIQEMILAGTL